MLLFILSLPAFLPAYQLFAPLKAVASPEKCPPATIAAPFDAVPTTPTALLVRSLPVASISSVPKKPASILDALFIIPTPT